MTSNINYLVTHYQDIPDPYLLMTHYPDTNPILRLEPVLDDISNLEENIKCKADDTVSTYSIEGQHLINNTSNAINVLDIINHHC